MKNIRAIVLIAIMAPLLVAHRVNIFALVEGDSIVCQCYYNDGAPVHNQKIEVFRTSGEKLLEGQTDDAGYFRFAPRVGDDLKIVLYAGMGHKAETIIKASGLPEVKKPRVEKTSISQKAVEVVPEKTGLDEDQLRRIVGEVVEEKFSSLRELIIKQQRSTSLTAIIGGIGYIFGIFGLLLYLRKKRQP